MSNKNYTHYSKMSREVEDDDESVLIISGGAATLPEDADRIESFADGVEPDTVIESAPIPAVEPEHTITPEICKLGKVINCKKLNVRKLPKPTAEIVSELDEGVEVMIDENASTAVFYKVYTECGLTGYCMKQFIKVLP